MLSSFSLFSLSHILISSSHLFYLSRLSFFASYHGYRKALHMYFPQPAENNVFLAAALSLTPVAAIPALRFMFPYGVVLIGLDAINGLNDI